MQFGKSGHHVTGELKQKIDARRDWNQWNGVTPASPKSLTWQAPRLCLSLQSLLPEIFRPKWHTPDIVHGIGNDINNQGASAHLIEVEDQVQLADVVKEGICFECTT
jgi:hypothetical protein